MTVELPVFQWNPCFTCKSVGTKCSSVGVSTLLACTRHDPASQTGTQVLLLPIHFTLSARDVPCQARCVGKVHQQDTSDQELPQLISCWPSKLSFFKPVALLALPWLAIRLPLMDGSTPKFPLQPQKQSRKPSPSFLGKKRRAGLLNIKVVLHGRRRSCRLVMGSLIPCPARMFAWAQPSRASDDGNRQCSLSFDILSAGFIRVSTQPPHSRTRLFWPAFPASGQGLCWSWAHLSLQGNLTAGFKLLIYFFRLSRKSELKKKAEV